jgi:hypothetical protein
MILRIIFCRVALVALALVATFSIEARSRYQEPYPSAASKVERAACV